MARRDFRQLGPADGILRRRGKKSAWLDRLDAAHDWPALGTIVEGVYASREGGLAYPLLTYVELLLLQKWYGLSDEGLEAAVDDRLSFRRFAGIPLAESMPDHSSSGASGAAGETRLAARRDRLARLEVGLHGSDPPGRPHPRRGVDPRSSSVPQQTRS
jgi:transposase-like protein DUF772